MYSWFGEMGGGLVGEGGYSGSFVSTEIDIPHIGLEATYACSAVLVCLRSEQCAGRRTRTRACLSSVVYWQLERRRILKVS